MPEGVLVYTIDGPFFFGAVEQFESALLHTHTDPRAIVLSLERVPFIDLTGLVALREAVERLEGRGVRGGAVQRRRSAWPTSSSARTSATHRRGSAAATLAEALAALEESRAA